MKEAGGDDKTGAISQWIGGAWKLGPMRVSVKDREHRDDDGGGGKRQTEAYCDCRPQNQSRQRDRYLRHRQRDAQHAGTPPNAITSGKVIGSTQIAGAPSCAPQIPTATIAIR